MASNVLCKNDVNLMKSNANRRNVGNLDNVRQPLGKGNYIRMTFTQGGDLSCDGQILEDKCSLLTKFQVSGLLSDQEHKTEKKGLRLLELIK